MSNNTTSDNTIQEKIVKSGNKQIKVTAESSIDIRAATEAVPFKEWLTGFKHNELTLKGVHIQSIDIFPNGKVGFIKFKADVEKDNKLVPGIVFLRGGSVAILTILVCNGIEYTLGTVQPRVPIGRYFLETPAGMIDDNTKNFIGVAAKEMQEETEITISTEKLIDLTELAYNGRYQGIIPSAGGCDEFIRCYVYRQEVTLEKLQQFNQKLTGLLSEGESITLRVIPLQDFWKETSDVKALCCLFLYYMLLKEGKINLEANSELTETDIMIAKENNPMGVIDFYKNLQSAKSKLKEVMNGFREKLKDSGPEINAVEQYCNQLIQEFSTQRKREVEIIDLQKKNAELKADKCESETSLKNELLLTQKLLQNEKKAKSLYQISLTVILCTLTTTLILRYMAQSINFDFPPLS